MPLSNAFVRPDRDEPESFYPLVAYVCSSCYLVQVPQVVAPEDLFGDYAYFSSYADASLESARSYAEGIRVRLGLDSGSQVVEVGSNDGYLLRFFGDAGIPALGIEPAENVAEVARANGIETWARFFGVTTAREIEGRADLLVANNVIAHVPDLTDFVEGMRIALAPTGTATIEFQHLLQMMRGSYFDSIYHEHHSYLSLLTMREILGAHGLEVVHVEEIPAHGGSLRVHAQHLGRGAVQPTVEAVLDDERAFGMDTIEPYRRFKDGIAACKRSLRMFLGDARANGKSVVGYGAAAKATTLLNYCAAGADLIDYTVDKSPHKQGRYLPGIHLLIRDPQTISQTRPDYVLILAWNLKDEIMRQMAHVRDWGGRFVVPIPTVEVLA
jgi:hypothetical protein